MADNAVYRALKLYVNDYSFLALFSLFLKFHTIFEFAFLNLTIFFSHIAQDKFYIEPRDHQSVGDQILEIDRVTQELSLAGIWNKFIKLLCFVLRQKCSS